MSCVDVDSCLFLRLVICVTLFTAAFAESPASALFDDPSALFDDTSCNVAVVPELSLSEFTSRFKGKQPVIFSRGLNLTLVVRERLSREALLEDFGDHDVILASSESYSHAKRETSLRNYITNIMQPQNPSSLANESWYLFGDTIGPEWAPLVEAYPLPMDAAADNGIRAWGCGARLSGVSFHTHGAAFAETLHGRKRWYLAAPPDRPVFSPNRSQLQWVIERSQLEVSSRVAAGATSASASVLSCTAGPGQVLYIPPQWWHATLNLDDWNSFISTFTMEKWDWVVY